MKIAIVDQAEEYTIDTINLNDYNLEEESGLELLKDDILDTILSYTDD